MIKISVIIPTYKPKDYIWDCLESLCNQTLANCYFDVFVILNGCSEPFDSQIKSFISLHPEVQWNFIQTNTPGVSNARNIALNIARGKYITFLDDDDFISPSCLEEMLKLQDSNSVVECYPFAFFDTEPKKQVPYGLTNVYDYCVSHHCHTLNSHARKFFSGPCMKLIPRKYIRNNRFNTNFAVGEDSLFMFSISDMIGNIVYTSRNAIYYRRIRPNSAINSLNSTKDIVILNLRCIMEYVRLYKPRYHSVYFFASRIVASILSILKSL